MSNRQKVVVTCPKIIPNEHIGKLEEYFQVIRAGCELSEESISDALKSSVGLVMGGEEKITLEVLKKAKLKWIVFLGIQFDTFFTEEALHYCNQKNIPIYPTGGGINAVALTTADEILYGRGRRARKDKVSIIGAGNIGSKTLQFLNGKVGKLIYWNRQEVPELEKIGIQFEPDLEKAFTADVVSIHLAYIPGITEDLIRYYHLAKISPGGLLINNARAGIVKASDFLNFLREHNMQNLWDVFYIEGAELIQTLKSREGTYYEIFKHFSTIRIFPNRVSDSDKNPNWEKIWQEIFDEYSSSNLYTSHTAAMRQETFQEYGESLINIIKEKGLDK